MPPIQLPMFDLESSWVTPTEPISWAGAVRACVDVETYDPQLTELGIGVRRGGYVVGVSVALQRAGECAAQATARYYPMRHAAGDNCTWDVVSWLAREAAEFRGEICGANLPYDLEYLAALGVHFSRATWFRDAQIAEPLLDELQFSYSLENIAQRRGFTEGKDELHLEKAAERWGLHPKKDLWKLPARHVGAYAEMDTLLPLKILERQEREIDQQDLRRIYNLESALLPVLVKMRRRGVAVDFGALDRVEAHLVDVERKALDEINSSCGYRIPFGELSLPAHIEGALRATGWTPTVRTATGLVCLKAAVIQGIDHPVARAILRARQVNKIRTTFAESIRQHAVNGRIHCTFHQLKHEKDDGEEGGAAYGRLSCSDPNLQQQPARDEELGPLWRSIYVPDEGCAWVSADYSAQEPRWCVHYANRIGAPGAAEMVERYRAEPRTDLHQAVADLAGIKRKQAKTIFLGLCYGMGGAKLCRSLGFSTEWKTAGELGWRHVEPTKRVEVAGPEGAAFLEKFRALVPFLGVLAGAATRRASSVGYVVTAGGRRCRFPVFGKKYEYTHKALNRVIQGSSGDQTKAALVELDRRGFPVQLQIHDEIAMSVTSREQGEDLGRIMETVMPMDVPCVSDLEPGRSWGDAMRRGVAVGKAIKENPNREEQIRAENWAGSFPT